MWQVFVALVVLIVVWGGWKLMRGTSGAVMTADELEMRMKQDEPLCIMDVRSREEYGGGHVQGAIHMEHNQVHDRLEELQNYRETDVVVYCEHGLRAAVAIRALEAGGFEKVFHLKGDMAGWRSAKRPMEAGQ